MDRLAQLDALVRMGFEIRVRQVQIVRNSQDATAIIVNVGDEITGNGLTPAEALDDALLQLKTRIEARAKRDQAVLAALNSAA